MKLHFKTLAETVNSPDGLKAWHVYILQVGLSLLQALLGFVALNPTYILPVGIAKCETQSTADFGTESQKFLLDQTGRSRPAAALNPNIIERDKSLKFIARINEKVKWIMAAVDPAPEPGPFAGFENALNKSIMMMVANSLSEMNTREGDRLKCWLQPMEERLQRLSAEH